METGKIIVVSVPYNWPEGACKYHCQDPVTPEKLAAWFNKEPLYLQVVSTRMIAVFKSGLAPGERQPDTDAFRTFYNWEQDGEKGAAPRQQAQAPVRGSTRIHEEYRWLKQASDPDLRAWMNISEKEIHQLAMAPDRGMKREEYLKLGLALYPFILDKWGSPKYLKEYIRFLLSMGEFKKAEALRCDRKLESVRMFADGSWADILFARAFLEFKRYREAYELFSKFPAGSNSEIDNAVIFLRKELENNSAE